MIRRTFWQLVLVVAFVSPSLAHDSRVEINGFAGYTFSEGVTVDQNTVIGILVDKVNPTSAFSWRV